MFCRIIQCTIFYSQKFIGFLTFSIKLYIVVKHDFQIISSAILLCNIITYMILGSPGFEVSNESLHTT